MGSFIFLLCSAPCYGQSPLQEKRAKPNILFMMSDDHCERAMGVYGSRLATLDPTPNLDKLAREGMTFDNVFCTNSICTPSRATIITGQYSHKNKVYDLYDGLPGDRHYLTQEMKKAGYAIAVVGKWHLRHAPSFVDYFAVIPGQGSYINPVIHVSEGGEKRRIRYDSILEKEVCVIETRGHSSDVLTDLSLDWLKNKRDQSKPFFLMHHFKAPHDMFTYAPRYKDYLADATIAEPDNLYDQPGAHFGSIATRGKNDALVNVIGSTISPQPSKRNLARSYRHKIEKLTGKKKLSNKELTHHTYQLYVKEYLRCVKGIDDNLGRILAYLKENNLLDNTIIVYTSDQGMLLGEHDFIDKRWMYEESIRMPLIVRYPKMIKANSRNDWLINNTDYAPTLLTLAGVDVPACMQGKSFANALSGAKEPKTWRQATYYRYWMHMAHGHNNPAHFGIRTKKYKLIFFYGVDYTDIHNKRVIKGKEGNRFWKSTPAAWELYDLQNDPTEMVNQYSNPDYARIVKQLKQMLQNTRGQIGDTDEPFPRIKMIYDDNF
ncbi:MAG: sulfatase [Phycisphaerae bacterium]|nr:sulfatase [Phycisphaerae bacterium]